MCVKLGSSGEKQLFPRSRWTTLWRLSLPRPGRDGICDPCGPRGARRAHKVEIAMPKPSRPLAPQNL